MLGFDFDALPIKAEIPPTVPRGIGGGDAVLVGVYGGSDCSEMCPTERSSSLVLLLLVHLESSKNAVRDFSFLDAIGGFSFLSDAKPGGVIPSRFAISRLLLPRSLATSPPSRTSGEA